MGLASHLDLIEAFAWHLLIGPYIWVSYLQSHGASFDVISMEPHESYSTGVVFVGIIAMVAAIGLAFGSRYAYLTWVLLLLVGAVSLIGYFVGAFSPLIIVSTGLEISCFVAFVLATRDSAE